MKTSKIKVAIIEEDGNEFLQIILPINERTSQSGNSTLIATTHGNKLFGLDYKGKPVRVGAFAYYVNK